MILVLAWMLFSWRNNSLCRCFVCLIYRQPHLASIDERGRREYSEPLLSTQNSRTRDGSVEHLGCFRKPVITNEDGTSESVHSPSFKEATATTLV